MLRAENRANLIASGFVVYLNVPPQMLWERTRNDRNRPLLKVADRFSSCRNCSTSATTFTAKSPISSSTAAEPVRKESCNC